MKVGSSLNVANTVQTVGAFETWNFAEVLTL